MPTVYQPLCLHTAYCAQHFLKLVLCKLASFERLWLWWDDDMAFRAEGIVAPAACKAYPILVGDYRQERMVFGIGSGVCTIEQAIPKLPALRALYDTVSVRNKQSVV